MPAANSWVGLTDVPNDFCINTIIRFLTGVIAIAYAVAFTTRRLWCSPEDADCKNRLRLSVCELQGMFVCSTYRALIRNS